MENKNNNGRGIFYGVIGVATLVVAIIGATFAYFTASITKNNAITNVSSEVLTLGFETDDTNFRTDMIPVNADGNGATFAKFPGMIDTASSALGSDALAAGNTCRDLVGNSICSAYQFTISNESETTAQTVVGSMTVVLNEFDNLHYALFRGASDSISDNGGFNVDATPAATSVTSNNWVTRTDANVGTLIHKGNLKTEAAEVKDGETVTKTEGLINWPNTLEQLTSTSSTDTTHNTTTYTIIVWLEETGEKQEEQGKNFTASITFTSDTGTGGVTGVLTAGA